MDKVFNFFRRVRKALFAFAIALCSAFALKAEGTGPDMSAATDALTTLKDALVGQNGWISSAAPILALLLGGVLVITLIWVAYKWVTRGAKKAG